MNKKGFTLIELLAVIVILAIIALIATPIVLNIIEDSKKSSTLNSANHYLDAVENAIMKYNMNNSESFVPSECKVQSDGNLKCDGKDITVEVDGEKPTSGTITFDKGKIDTVDLVLSNKTITTDDQGKLIEKVELAPGLYDENDNLRISWEDLTSTEYKSFSYYDYNIGEYVTSAILNVDENGVLNSTYDDADEPQNYSAEYLVGKLVIDNSVTSIGESAFDGCTGLTNITIPDSVTYIARWAFDGCTGLTNITIPDSVTGIGFEAFVGCSSLTSIKVDENNKVYDSRDNSNAIIETASNTLIAGCKNTIIPSSVTRINDSAFSGCTGLTNITIPDSVTFIGNGAFRDCSSLTNITIPDSVTYIRYEVFSYCSGLTSITIPDSVTNIDSRAFNGCTGLISINYTGTEKKWNGIFKSKGWDNGTPSNKVINCNYVG